MVSNSNTATKQRFPTDRQPADRQVVEVRLANSDWQPATYSGGEFVDVYGMPLDRARITGWRPVSANAGNQG